ncbi:type II toxin-antitoxin system RelE family toxin [Leptospira interrogans]|nr:hypothetical protein [Leptospira interrogans]EMN95868.1 hypothetical protein LEP1GSC110_0760 [Leptospira interrogans serovar Medanensis str. UT053]EMO94611.1 hypothetical protein LEP1GSC109_3283 [Leptospira interrogans str. UI 13372]
MQSPLNDFYRMVVWPYRVLFFLNETKKEITIDSIGQREGVYNKR